MFRHLGELGEGQEWRVELRTLTATRDKLAARIKELHPWDNPELTGQPIEWCSDDYADLWSALQARWNRNLRGGSCGDGCGIAGDSAPPAADMDSRYRSSASGRASGPHHIHWHACLAGECYHGAGPALLSVLRIPHRDQPVY